MRHYDFQRIHDEFVNYYKTPLLGETEYYDWLKALSLDEGKPYGQAKERFQWARDMIKAIGEDKENKYYKVLVAFPLESMNGNVYREADLREDAKRITQGHPSLNHKDEFWLSPDNPHNRWGTVDITGAEWEDGAVEALLKVPKTTLCPVCSEAGKPLYQMIDERRIVNVSLEGFNSADGHFMFDQNIPFTLLTSNVLPGIPLARIKPLEKIMVEALQVSTGKPKIVTIKAKVTEIAQPPEPPVDVNTNSKFDPDFKMTAGTPLQQDSQIDTQSDNAKTVVGGSVPDNIAMSNTDKSLGAVPVPKEAATCNCPPGMHPENGECVPDQKKESAPPVEPLDSPGGGQKAPTYAQDSTETGRSKPPERSIPSAGSLPGQVAIKVLQGEAPAGSATPRAVVGTAPVEQLNSETLAEKVLRFKAEDKARSLEEQLVNWQKRFTDANEQLIQTNGALAATKQQLSQSEERKEQAIRDMHVANVDKEKEMRLRNDAAGERDDARRNFEAVKRDFDNLNTKYQSQLQTNLNLSQKLTAANEDYLAVAKKLESTEEALGRARNEAKRITKITA